MQLWRTLSILSLTTVLLTNVPAHAQDEGPRNHYPHEIVASDQTTDAGYLTRASMVDVQLFFSKLKDSGDRFVEETKNDKKIATLIISRGIQGPKREWRAVEISQPAPANPDEGLPVPIGYMKQLIGRYGHTQLQYSQEIKKFRDLSRALYREVPDGEGWELEDKVIIAKCENNAFGDALKSEPPDATAAQEKDAEDLSKKLEELEKKGDVAGMVALAQQAQGKAQRSPQMKAARRSAAELKKDTWNIWETCLQNLMNSAYWTHITYVDPGFNLLTIN